MMISVIGKWLIAAGLITALVGLILIVGGKLFPSFGHLPGDIHVQRESGSFHFPVVTCLVISVALTVIINLLLRVFRG